MCKSWSLWIMVLIINVSIYTAGCRSVQEEEVSPATPTPEWAAYPGVFFGTFHGEHTSSAQLAEAIGKPPAISAYYLSWGNQFYAGTYEANALMGRISMITWEYQRWGQVDMSGYQDYPLQAILDGVHDAQIEQWAARSKKFERPVFIRFGHEMNGDWYPWGGRNNGAGDLDGFGDPAVPDGPERFVAAYQYIHDSFVQAGADNVLWVWCPNAPFEIMDTAYGGGSWNEVVNYYPGDEYVDWLCFDGYNWGTSAFGQSFNASWAEFDAIFSYSYQVLQNINTSKPIMIGEFASTEDGGDKAAWVREAFQAIEQDYPQIRGVIWFHINKETDWRINSSPEVVAAFKKALADDYWQSAWPGFGP